MAVVAASLAALRERLPSHPSLAPLIDTGVVDVEPFIVSPSIDGDSLDVALREFGPANMADALPRLRALADAMDAAAAVGVSHGSLHLRDIVVSVDETVLTGMGVAAVLERVGVRPPVRRPYCAPEVALGHGISPAADQYALAAIAHEWLSGRRISGTGAAGFQMAAVSEAGADALHAVFARAMHEAPEHRYPTATAFVEAIAAQAGHAAARPKAVRRPAVVEAPRLAFDEPADASDSDDDVVPPDDTPSAAVADIDDPLDRPLMADSSEAALAWEPDVIGAAALPERPLADVEGVDGDGDERDDMAPAPRDAWTPAPVAEEWASAAAVDVDQVPKPSGATWVAWAAALFLMASAVVAGGWALLRWGTPSSAVVSTTRTPEPEAPAANAPSAVPSVEASASPARGLQSLPAPAVPAVERPTPPTLSPPVAASPPTAVAPARRAAANRTASRPPAAVAEAGRLLVRSTPAGAEVFMNGERRGVTPLAMRDLPFGAYSVRVVRAGYAPVEQRVAIEAGRPARSLELTLARGGAASAAPPASAEATVPGSLLVETRPAGARVLLDGDAVGVTPLTVPAVAPGAHTVRIERAGYAPITTTARIEARTRARVAVTLTAERPR